MLYVSSDYVKALTVHMNDQHVIIHVYIHVHTHDVSQHIYMHKHMNDNYRILYTTTLLLGG